MSASCGAPDQSGVQLGSVAGGTTLVEGTVRRDGAAVAGAYVRLLDGSGEFTAEVVSGDGGQFRFHAAPGTWTVRALARGAEGSSTLQADPGSNRVDVALAAG